MSTYGILKNWVNDKEENLKALRTARHYEIVMEDSRFVIRLATAEELIGFYKISNSAGERAHLQGLGARRDTDLRFLKPGSAARLEINFTSSESKGFKIMGPIREFMNLMNGHLTREWAVENAVSNFGAGGIEFLDDMSPADAEYRFKIRQIVEDWVAGNLPE